MKRRWLRDLKAMGNSPSPSLNYRRDKQVVLDKIATALSQTSLAAPPLSQNQISRIEARIFEQVFNESPPSASPSASEDGVTVLKEARPKVEGPVSPDVFKGNSSLRLTKEFALDGQLATITLTEESEDEMIDLSEMALPKPATLLVRRKWRGLKVTAITVGAAYLLSATVAHASQGSRAGEMLYPVKLQIEAIRLATSGGSADKARTYMSIAADRLQALRDPGSMEAGDISVAAGEMDGAGLHALRLSKESPEKSRFGLLGDLLALVAQEKVVLQALIERPSQEAIQSLTRSYSVAQRIELTALTLLLPTGTIPSTDSLSPPPMDTPSLRGAAPTSKYTSKSAPMGRANTGQQAERVPTKDSPPHTQEPDPDPDPPCAAENGEICIILPIQLSGVLPT